MYESGVGVNAFTVNMFEEVILRVRCTEQCEGNVFATSVSW
jgi:hypothetical protein